MKILCIISRWDYGDKKRGDSFEFETFYSFFKNQEFILELLDMDNLSSNNLKEKLLRFQPDLIFIVPTINSINYEVIKTESLDTNVKTLAWMSDDKWRWESFSKKICRFFDWVVTTDPDAVSKYKSIGYKNIILSQWACNIGIYKKIKIKKDIDVSFIGQVNPWRKYVVNQLNKNGIEVECFGYGWGNGRVRQEEIVKIFNLSRINLNLSNSVKWDFSYLTKINFNVDSKLPFAHKIFNMFPLAHSILYPKKQEDIKSRLFEVTGCGSFLLSYYVSYLENYFNIGKEIDTFEKIKDLTEKINYYLSHEKERERIAVSGYKRTLSEHTYENRFKEIFSKLNL